MSARRLLVARVLVAFFGLASAVYAATHLRVGGEITHFLPPGHDADLGRILRAFAESRAGRTLVLVLESDAPGTSIAEGRALEAQLRRTPGVASIRGGVEGRFERDFHTLFFPARLSFASWGDERGLAHLLSADGLRERAQALKRALAGSEAPFARATAPADPLLTFVAQAKRARSLSGTELPRLDERFLTLDGKHAVLFVELHGSGFDARRARAVLAAIDRFVVSRRHEVPSLRVAHAGVPFVASASESSIRGDIERVSALSTIGIVLLFVVMFRSPRYLLAALLPLAYGTAVALAACTFVFGRIHGVTLAFGSALIGVAIDYVEHFVNHHVLDPDESGPEGTLRRIWPGIALGGATTASALLGLGFSSYPGIREFAWFGSIGVAAAIVATRTLVSPLLPRKPVPTRIAKSVAAALARAYESLATHRGRLFVVPVVCLVLVCLGLPRVRFVDDVQKLHQLDPHVLREDTDVMGRIGGKNEGTFVAVTGPNDEVALERAFEASRRLGAVREAGAFSSMTSVTSLILPSRIARAILDAFRARPELPSELERALDAEGFRPEAFAPFREAYPSLVGARPVTLEAVEKTSLAPLLAPFVLRDSKGTILLLPLRGVRDDAAIARALAGVPGAQFVDRDALLVRAYRTFRSTTLELAALGMVAVFLLCLLRYRNLRWALAAFAPALVGALVALAVQALFGVRLNLLHVLGVVLVLGMGVDYGVFVVESREHPEELPVTLASTFVAMLTTVLSFGVLGVSAHPALRAIGVTTSLGVFLAMATSPISLLLASPGTREKGPTP